jgi:hypothetical protein
VSEAAEAVCDSEEHENESATISESWRGNLDHVTRVVRMIVSPWYLDELGNPTPRADRCNKQWLAGQMRES